MTFLHSHTHSDTILGSLLGFISANNLCFCGHSRWIHASSINCNLPPGHFVWICTNGCPRTHTHSYTSSCTHRHTSVALNTFLKWQKPTITFCYVLAQMLSSFHDLVVSLHPPHVLHAFIYSDFYHFLSLVAGLGCSFNVYVYSDAPPSFSPCPHLFQFPPQHPCVQLLLRASFP